jgi:hypothetical protein
MTGSLLWNSIEATKLGIGARHNIFHLNCQQYQCILAGCWIKEIWKLASKKNIKITSNTITKLGIIQRYNTVFLMEIYALSNTA